MNKTTKKVRTWEGIPVRDSERELWIFPTQQDITAAIPKDEQFCVFANTCRGVYGSTRVIFLRTTAYVELLDEQGQKIIERFQLGDKTKRAIAEFDKTGPAQPGGYLLSAPRPSLRLEQKSERYRQWN